MRFFYREGEWKEDKREYKNKSSNKKREKDSNLIYKNISVSDALYTIGIFYDVPEKSQRVFDVEKHTEFRYVLNSIQNYSNQNMMAVFVLLYDDDSPVIFKSHKIAIFDNEDIAKEILDEILNKLIKIGSNVSVKMIKFAPER